MLTQTKKEKGMRVTISKGKLDAAGIVGHTATGRVFRPESQKGGERKNRPKKHVIQEDDPGPWGIINRPSGVTGWNRSPAATRAVKKHPEGNRR